MEIFFQGQDFFVDDDSRLSAIALQISLDLCIPEKELAKTRFQISFIYFQSHSWYSARNY